MEETEEIWKPVLDYEGYYEVSSLGRVRSLDRFVTSSKAKDKVPRFAAGKMMIPRVGTRGYLAVHLSKNGKSRWVSLHRIIATAFIPTDDITMQIDHIDRCKTNNSLTNLRWVTHNENMQNRGVMKHNKLGELHITMRGDCFRVRKIKDKHLVADKLFKTLEEAKAFRLEKFGV